MNRIFCPNHFARLAFSSLALLISAAQSDALVSAATAELLPADQAKFFETKIRPVLIKECYGCHSAQAGNVRGGLRLDTKELTQLGGSSGPAVVAGDLDESLLWGAINHDSFEMPPRRKLSANVIADFRRWIEMGAPDPRTREMQEVRSSITADDIEDARHRFWAYQVPMADPIPTVQQDAWPNSDIDRFVLAKLEAAEMRPSPDAEAHQVLRRLCFDLIGLPPTPDQIQAFVQQWQRSPERAIAKLVEELLEQPQFGERWGRHWLDVVRYAESTGREVNMTYPHAWRYRDFVIESFNADKPFDQFVQQQIAGDLMPSSTDEEWTENLIATTFLAIGPKNINEQNRIQFEADLVDEQIDATTRVFLGMSVACARCHDHKFDAIPQSDYYAMAGLFANATTYFGNPPSQYGNIRSPQARRSSSLLRLPIDDPNPFDPSYSAAEIEELREETQQAMQTAIEARRNRNQSGAAVNRIRAANRAAQLSAKLAVVDASGKPRSYCMGVQEKSPPQDVRLLVRGEIDQAAQVISRGFPQVLCTTEIHFDSDDSGRLALARWIGSEQNTLTARVMVNRIWHAMMGRGLVSTTENFGITGAAPSHPKLLDYLAIRFVKSSWSVKSIVRAIANSHTYRISSRFHEPFHNLDPNNELLWRANPRRLDAESIRDAMLSVSGQIDLQRPRASEVAKAGYVRVREGVLGDPRDSIRESMQQAMEKARQEVRQQLQSQLRSVAQRRQASHTEDNRERFRQAMAAKMREFARRHQHQLDMEEAKYRSVYLPIVRDHEPRALDVFDFADSNAVTGRRETSNTANQALYMMNNRFVLNQSSAFADRIGSAQGAIRDQIHQAFLLAYGRPPTSGEQSATATFFKRFGSNADRDQTMAVFCQSLFASAEFRYVD